MEHQVINEKKPKLEMNPSSLDQPNMANLGGEVSVLESVSCEKALKNSVVLRTIMNHLDDRDLLLSCRLVSKLWKEEATIQLLSTRQKIQVRFEWDEKELKFRNKIGTLKEFTDSYYGNPLRKFPCSQFCFVDVTTSLEFNKGNVDLFKFFSTCGHNVKSLCLDSIRKSTSSSLNFMRKIVFEWIPSLKSLTLKDLFNVDGVEDEPSTQENEITSMSSFDNGFKLYKLSLEHLEIFCHREVENNSVVAQGWSRLIQDILLSTPNIKQITDEKLWFTKEIISAGKIGAVHRLVWEVYSPDMIHRYVKFLQARPQLTYLKVHLRLLVNNTWIAQTNPPNNFLTSLKLILQSSQETLKTLEIWGRLDLINGISQLKIPVMKNLQEFRVIIWHGLEGGQGKLLPEGFYLKKSFPRLKTLHIEDVGDKEINGGVDNPFGYDCNSSETVEELGISTSYEYDRLFESSWLIQARNLYRNVRVLHFDFYGSMDEMPEICHTIWKYWNDSLLEELNIDLPEMDSNSAEIMDQALTGLDQETCEMVQEQHKSGRYHGRFEQGPSISDMKKLKLLQLTFHCVEDSNDSPMFSQVSVIHAFEPMRQRQNLIVKINGIELKEMIQHSSVDFSICQKHRPVK